jgi:hypothetical protein
LVGRARPAAKIVTSDGGINGGRRVDELRDGVTEQRFRKAIPKSVTGRREMRKGVDQGVTAGRKTGTENRHGES